MKVSKRGEYGMAALCHLAERYGGGPVRIGAIAEAEEVPFKFLESILLLLKRGGFVQSRRGHEGGYALARRPEEITVGEVTRLLDGPLAPLASASELRSLIRRRSKRAGYYAILMDVRDAVASILDHTTVADVVARGRALEDPGEPAGD